MFMKGTWLLLSLCCIGTVYFKNNIWMIFMISIFIFVRNREKSIYFCIFLLFTVYFLSNDLVSVPESTIGKVIKLNRNSVILEVDDSKIIGYNFKDVILDDVVYFEGEYTFIQSSLNTYGFNYEQWCHQNNIYYSVYAKNIKIIKKSNSIRGLFQKSVEKLN